MMPNLVDGFLFYVVFLFSVTLHEAAHAWAAMRGGDRTAYDGGQVTLDPMPHIRREPVGMVLLPAISVLVVGWPLGFASAPYDRRWAERHPSRAGWMALAGPGANLLLVLVAALLINLGVLAGVFYAPDTIHFADVTAATAGRASWWYSVGYVVGAVFAMNLLLFVFNLLPLPPLDGSAALVLVLPEHWVGSYQRFIWENGQLALVGIFIAWTVFAGVFDPVFTWAISVLYPGVTYS
jgi:Zn-dependent protease